MTWRPVDLDPVVLVMVGKPARGKTFTARRAERYLRWLGYRTQVFNVGAYRRDHLGAGQPPAFFDPANPEGAAARQRMAELALDGLVEWLEAGGEVGIYDATNSTRARRRWLQEQLARLDVRVVFIELVTTDATKVERNVREIKVRSPDYAGVSPDAAAADFFARIAQYDEVYETVTEDEGAFIRIVDLGRRVELHEIHGFLPGRLVTFLMHLHDTRRPILLSRHGQSLFNVEGRIGGDTGLSDAGQQYAQRLATFVDAAVGDAPLTVWASTLRRTHETAAPLGRPLRAWKLLDEIDAGVFEGFTYAEIAQQQPQAFAARAADKFRYRYPSGESYQDVIARLDPVVLELERQQRPVLVIAHQAVLRALLSYLRGTPPDQCPHLAIPLHTVLRLTPGPYGNEEEREPLGPEVKA